MVVFRDTINRIVMLAGSFLVNELYDLEKDPGEMNNLINNPAYTDVLADMKKEQQQLIQKLGYHHDRDFWLRKVVGD